MGLFSFLSKKLPIDTAIIEQAIAHLESQTSAELRVVVERKARIDNLDNVNDVNRVAISRANQLFDELNMRETAARNGVLIYLAFKPHYVAVIGDEGIHQKVGDDFWDAVYRAMRIDCQNGDYTDAICKAISTIETPLALHFPYQDDDVNELPNEVVIK